MDGGELMPTSSDRQRALMKKWFGDDIAEDGPMSLLESHGYVLTIDWSWELPTPGHYISDIEMECLHFLIDEWDFGGIVL
jgi:hypothetical protein